MAQATIVFSYIINVAKTLPKLPYIDIGWTAFRPIFHVLVLITYFSS